MMNHENGCSERAAAGRAATSCCALDQECLLDYIKSGGASVKVVSGSDADLSDVQRERVRERAREEGYLPRVPRPRPIGSGRQKAKTCTA